MAMKEGLGWRKCSLGILGGERSSGRIQPRGDLQELPCLTKFNFRVS